MKQKRLLSHTFFSLFLAAVLDTVRDDQHKGIFISTRTDGKLFNFFRFRSSIKIKEMLVRKLLYANDLDCVSSSIENTQYIVNQIPCATVMFGPQDQHFENWVALPVPTKMF